jgi:putative acetyltransferase
MTEIAKAEAPNLAALYPQAFPDEDLLPLVRQMVGQPQVVSLVAGSAEAPIGHICMTYGSVAGQSVALLGPLCVAPAHQKTGIGTALIQAGLEAVLAGGAEQVLVLGDPNYYGRFGFQQESEVAPPYNLPAEWAPAWQSLSLDEEVPQGRLELPDFWMNPAYWSD